MCGFLGCDEPIFDPLISALPPAIVQRGAAGSWLESLLAHVTRDGIVASTAPGERGMCARLVELLFIEVLRRYIAELPAGRTGWLAGLRDPTVGRAVAELHREPGRDWTVDTLARRVGDSRSMLARRFHDVAGLSPMRDLAAWRLQVASDLFRRSEPSIAEAAARVGYQSEAAFHRAFKRLVGEPPAAWRRRVGQPLAAAAS